MDTRSALEARPQRIVFDSAPTPQPDERSVVVAAHASSGLPVVYTSLTPGVCTVEPDSGQITARTSGTCVVEANQHGDVHFAPARPETQSIAFRFSDSIQFASVSMLGLHDVVKVDASATGGEAIVYSTSTPENCSVDRHSGIVVALDPGTCIVAAATDTTHSEQAIVVAAPQLVSVPAAPKGVTATSAGNASSVLVTARAINSGGSPIAGYRVSSVPPGISATRLTLPVVASCGSSCSGYAFTLAAYNALGEGPFAAAVDIITEYSVKAVFHEPDTHPNQTVFLGKYSFNATSRTVSGLEGQLSEAMTGSTSPYPNETMTWLPLRHQLISEPVVIDRESGLLVTTFLLPTTNTLTDSLAYGGTDGWTPGSGFGLHYGYPGHNPGNAYVTVFVDVDDPLAAPTPAQLARLAYADCAPGGMMGATCMTGTSVEGYGTLGTMGGTPSSQVTIQQQ